ncbi:hypothetical protein SRABI96_00624 [Peribacillus sp. Bi96]|nr:hypothetical protein SRABI96_00624 [Peribacillus sp. Bi96]
MNVLNDSEYIKLRPVGEDLSFASLYFQIYCNISGLLKCNIVKGWLCEEPALLYY